MKEDMVNLINELLTLPQPLVSENIYALFNQYERIFINVNPPEHLVSIWKTLKTIHTQVLEWSQLEAKHKESLLLNADIVRLKKDLSVITHQHKRHAEDRAKFEQQINDRYPDLLRAYHSHLYNQDPSMAVNAPSDLRGKKNLLVDYRDLLKEQYQTLDLKNIGLKLAEGLIARKQLVSQLQRLNIMLTERSIPYKLHETLKRKRDGYDTLKYELQKIQQELAEQISIDDIQDNIAIKRHELRKVEAELLSIDRKIAEIHLDSDVKQSIQRKYTQSSDKQAFLHDKETSLTWTGSTINPIAWYTWCTDRDFLPKLEQQKAEKYCADLLHQKAEYKQTQDSLKQQLDHLHHLDISPSTKPNPKHSKLNDHAIYLLDQLTQHDLKPRTIAKTNVDLLSEIIYGIGALSNKIDEFNAGLNFLLEIIAIDDQILELRTRYSLIDVDEHIPTKDTFDELQRSDSDRQNELMSLDQKIQSCDASLKSIEKYNRLSIQLKEDEEKKAFIKISLKEKKQTLDTVVDNNIESKIKQTHDLVTLQLGELNKLQQLLSHEETQRLPSLTDLDPHIDVLMTYQHTLNAWNRVFRNLICQKTLSPDLVIWYQKLFIALQTKVKNETSFHQSNHVLHDILFEIFHLRPAEPSSVLNAYRDLCPNPDTDCQKLLEIKPPIYSNKDTLPKPKDRLLCQQLEKLHEQVRRLSEKHPKEAELVRQAIHCIHETALFIERQPPGANVHPLHLLDDPRYELLKHHRGIGKIWQWLSNVCAMALGTITKRSDINQEPFSFFQRTRTVRLIDEATSRLTLSKGPN